jgi:hypothetical protein
MFQLNRSYPYIISLFAVLTLTSIPSFSQKQNDSRTTVIITVINASQNGAVVPGAQVLFSAENAEIRGETNSEGKLQIDLPRNVFTLTVTSFGFDGFERQKLRIRHLPIAIAADLIPSEISSHND